MIAANSLPSARNLALAILIGVAAAAGCLAYALASALQENRALIAEKAQTLQTLRGIAGQADAVEQWRAATAGDADQGLFLSGASEALVAATLQSRITEQAEANGVAPMSFRAIPPKTQDGLVDIAIEVDLHGTLAGLLACLEQLESSTPLLFVTRAEIRANQRAGTAAAEEVMLDAKLEVHGFMRAEAAQPTDS